MSRRHKNRNHYNSNQKGGQNKTDAAGSAGKPEEKAAPTRKRRGISFSLRHNTVHIFAGTLEALGDPDYIRLLLNKKEKRIAVQICEEIDRDGYHVPPPAGRGERKPFNIASLKFLRMIYKMAGWDKEKSYRIFGYSVENYRLVLFLMDEAEEITEEEFENGSG